MPPSECSYRINAPPIQLQTVTRHSTKIHEFFGIPVSASPTPNSTRNLVDDNVNINTNNPEDLASNARTSGTYNARSSGTYASVRMLKQQYSPAVTLYARRVKRGLSVLIQSCTPIW